MNKFIPYEKLSKKKKKEVNQLKRNAWNGVNPVTRKSKNLKAYDRKKLLKWTDDTFQELFVGIEAPPCRTVLQWNQNDASGKYLNFFQFRHCEAL